MGFLAAAPALLGPISAGAAATAGAVGVGGAAAGGSWLTSLLVGSAATGAGGIIGGGGSVTGLGLLGAGSTLFSAFSSFMGGNAQSAAYRSEGQFSEVQAKQEELAGKIQSNRIKQQLNEDLATQQARWGVAGIDPSSGTPGIVATQTIADASRQIGITREDAYYRALAQRIRARNSGIASNQSFLSGITDAGEAFGSFGAGVAARG